MFLGLNKGDRSVCEVCWALLKKIQRHKDSLCELSANMKQRTRVGAYLYMKATAYPNTSTPAHVEKRKLECITPNKPEVKKALKAEGISVIEPMVHEQNVAVVRCETNINTPKWNFIPEPNVCELSSIMKQRTGVGAYLNMKAAMYPNTSTPAHVEKRKLECITPNIPEVKKALKGERISAIEPTVTEQNVTPKWNFIPEPNATTVRQNIPDPNMNTLHSVGDGDFNTETMVCII